MNPEVVRVSRRSALRVSNWRCLLLATALALASTNAIAMDIREWRFQTSLYTKHWDPDPEHNNHQKLLNLELETTTKWIYGFAWFENSFDQPSQLLYAAYSWKLFRTDWAYFKLSGGLLHGYKEPYEDKIPLNQLGIAPVIIPALGVRYKRVFGEIQIAGTAAITITAGFNFGHKSD